MSVTSSPATPTVSKRDDARPGRAARSGLVGYGYWWWVIPAVVLVGAVIYLATAAGAFYAFTNWSGIGPYEFVGVSNFVKVFQNPQLLGALTNTVVLAVGFVVFTNIIGLGFALALNRTLKTRYLLRTLIFMPVVLSPVAVSFVWKFIFAYNGPLNQILGDVGLGSLRHNWLAVPKLALGCVLVVMVWQAIGFVAVVYLAGLATVPAELEEAAAIDGAGAWRRFRRITLPLMRPAAVTMSMLSLIATFNSFDIIWILTQGGPNGQTTTMIIDTYKTAMGSRKYGEGAARAVVICVFVSIFCLVYFRAVRKLSQGEAK